MDIYAKTRNHRKNAQKQPTENQTNIKTEISLKMAVRFSNLHCQGEPLHSYAFRHLRLWLWYIVLAYSKLSLFYCNRIPDDGKA